MTPALLFWIRIGVCLLIAYTLFTHIHYCRKRGYWVPKNKKDISVLGGDVLTLLGGFLVLFMLQKNFQEPMDKVLSYEKQQFPPLQFQLANDATVKALDEYQGNLILLNLWATWCGPCRKEMPGLDQLQKELNSSPFKIIALSDEQLPVVQKYLSDKPYSFIAGSITRSNDLINGIDTRPTSILIDKNGNVLDIVVGARGYRFFRNWVENYLK